MVGLRLGATLASLGLALVIGSVVQETTHRLRDEHGKTELSKTVSKKDGKCENRDASTEGKANWDGLPAEC